MKERLKRRRTAFGLLAAPLAILLIVVGPARASPDEATVQVNITVEPFAEIVSTDIVVHLTLDNLEEKGAFSTSIDVRANDWFDAMLTVEEDQLHTLGTGHRVPFAEMNGQKILYSPKLRNGDTGTASWSNVHEHAVLSRAVAPGESTYPLKVGVDSWMERTPSGEMALPGLYKGTMILTLVHNPL